MVDNINMEDLKKIQAEYTKSTDKMIKQSIVSGPQKFMKLYKTIEKNKLKFDFRDEINCASHLNEIMDDLMIVDSIMEERTQELRLMIHSKIIKFYESLYDELNKKVGTKLFGSKWDR